MQATTGSASDVRRRRRRILCACAFVRSCACGNGSAEEDAEPCCRDRASAVAAGAIVIAVVTRAPDGGDGGSDSARRRTYCHSVLVVRRRRIRLLPTRPLVDLVAFMGTKMSATAPPPRHSAWRLTLGCGTQSASKTASDKVHGSRVVGRVAASHSASRTTACGGSVRWHCTVREWTRVQGQLDHAFETHSKHDRGTTQDRVSVGRVAASQLTSATTIAVFRLFKHTTTRRCPPSQSHGGQSPGTQMKHEGGAGHASIRSGLEAGSHLLSPMGVIDGSPAATQKAVRVLRPSQSHVDHTRGTHLEHEIGMGHDWVVAGLAAC